MLTDAVLLQSTRPLTSRTTCLTDTHTWLPDSPVGWPVWLQAWPLASWAMLVSGVFAALCLLSHKAEIDGSATGSPFLHFKAVLSLVR